jgi:hypothetical protein
MALKGRTRKKLRVSDEIVALIRGCRLQLKRKIGAGLRHILTEPASVKSLKDGLEGLKGCRFAESG